MFSQMKSRSRGDSDLLPETLREWIGYFFGLIAILGGFGFAMMAGLIIDRPPAHEIGAAIQFFYAHPLVSYFAGMCFVALGAMVVFRTARHQEDRTRAVRKAAEENL